MRNIEAYIAEVEHQAKSQKENGIGMMPADAVLNIIYCIREKESNNPFVFAWGVTFLDEFPDSPRMAKNFFFEKGDADSFAKLHKNSKVYALIPCEIPSI